MAVATAAGAPVDGGAVEFHRHMLALLARHGVRHLVGGACALAHYTGIERWTTDVELFIARADLDRVAPALADAGYRAELTFPHWLAQVWCGPHVVNLVFGSPNGIATVDEEWFEHATRGEAFGRPVWLCPAEEAIWSKAFVMERERYDGADVAHLFHARGPTLDWRRLLRRFDPHWRILLSYVVLFGFVYPAERDVVPAWLMEELLLRMREDSRTAPPRERVCAGTLLSREQFRIDVEAWGYADARLEPRGRLSAEAIGIRTDAIG